MASAKLQITIESACNLYNSDGVLAGKSDPYVIVEVPGQEGMKLQTEVIDNELNPVWNFTGEIAGFMDGDVLCFTVMDKDTFPNPDDFLGKAELTAQDVYPNGFHGELTLADSKTQATLSVIVAVIDCDEAAPELVKGECAEMNVPDGAVVVEDSSGAVVVEGSSNAAVVLASGSFMQGLQVYNPGATSHSMTYSAPQADSAAPQTDAAPETDTAPQVPMDGMVTTSIVESQTMASEDAVYASESVAAQPSESAVAMAEVVEHPPVTATAEESALQPGPEPQTSQPMTYEAPEAPVPSESFAAVVVHPPVTVTAEEFAKINGTILTEPLPVTEGFETVAVGTQQEVEGLEMIFAGAKQEVDFDETEAVDETVKINKKTKRCCC